MDNNNTYNKEVNNTDVNKSKFVLVKREHGISDVKFDTKPVGYYRDAFRRFCRHKLAIAGTVFILLILLFALFTPLLNPYDTNFIDIDYKYALPKNLALSKIGLVTGNYKKSINSRGYEYLCATALAYADTDGKHDKSVEAGLYAKYSPIIGNAVKSFDDNNSPVYDVKVNSYYELGFVYKTISPSEYNAIRGYEQSTGRQILFPMVDVAKYRADNLPFGFLNAIIADANYWYKVNREESAVLKDGNFIDMYMYEYVFDDQGEIKYDNDGIPLKGPVVFNAPASSESETGETMFKVRVLYYEYFRYINGREPAFLFGINESGGDIWAHVAKGTLNGLALATVVAVCCFIIGSLVGALEGFYGGWLDLIVERVLDIIAGIPVITLMSLFVAHFVNTGIISPFLCLFIFYLVTGWLGDAGIMRLQFYRYKKQEFVLAARTLGANNSRLMFRHIFPNSLGTVITSAALVIPSVILTEATLSYLNIIRLDSSLGTMIEQGRQFLASYPHIIFIPALIIACLMISFNLLGNGLRDAFNPSLRGAE